MLLRIRIYKTLNQQHDVHERFEVRNIVFLQENSVCSNSLHSVVFTSGDRREVTSAVSQVLIFPKNGAEVAQLNGDASSKFHVFPI